MEGHSGVSGVIGRYEITLFIVLAGCASQPLTEVEEYNRQIDLQNWALCEAVYEKVGHYTYHIGHSHVSGRTRPDWVKDDLITNHCRMILKDYWAHRI